MLFIFAEKIVYVTCIAWRMFKMVRNTFGAAFDFI